MRNLTETMNGAQGCLSDETIRDYLRGGTAELQSFEIEMHIAQCARCEQIAEKLDSKADAFVGLLAGIESANVEEVPDRLAEVIAKIEQPFAEMARSSAPTNSLAGKLVGPYELLEPLGQGGMGVVYRARHRVLGKQFAVKILPGGDSLSQEAFERFRREIAASGRLNHPAIIAATDAGEHEGLHYLAMEVVEGLNLASISRRLGQLEIADACELIRQAALGLSHAHALGVIHRDIKPSNLMLDLNGNVKILDFGLAQLNAWNDPTSELTTVGQLLGTLDYMAPEQADRGINVDHRADLYSLGATLYALLCGRAPFAATPRQSPLEKLRLMATESPPNIQTLRPEVPQELAETIHRAIARHAEDRPSSAALVAEGLATFAANADLVTLIGRASATADRMTNPPSSSPWPTLAKATASSSSPPRRLTRIWAAFLGFLGMAAALGIWIVIETSKGQLIIETDSADVHVKLLSDGKEYDQLQLQPGTTATRLFAGKYEIVIDAPTDRYTIDRDTISLRRGETVVAKITTKTLGLTPESALANETTVTPSNNRAIESPQSADANSVTYNGKTLDQWLEIYLHERNVKNVDESTAAIVNMARGPERERVFQIILDSALGQPDDTFELDPVVMSQLRLFRITPSDANTVERLVTNLDPAAPKKTAWVLWALKSNVYTSKFDDTQFKKIFAGIGRLLESPNVQPDDPIAMSCGRALFEITKMASLREMSQLMDDAAALITSTNKLGPAFWIKGLAGEAIPKCLEAKTTSSAIGVIDDPASTGEMLGLASFQLRVQGRFNEKLSSSLDKAMTRVASDSEQLHAIARARIAGFVSNEDLNYAEITLQTYLPNSRIRFEMQEGRPFNSSEEVASFNGVLELLATYRPNSDSTDVPRGTNGLKQILSVTEKGFQTCIDVFRKQKQNWQFSIFLQDYSLSESKNRPTGLSREEILDCVIHVCARSIERQISDGTFDSEVASDVYSLLGKYDANFDDALSVDEIQSMENQPTAADADGDRSLSRKELLDYFALAKQPKDETKSAESTFGGRTIEEWMTIFRTDHDPKTVEQSASAIENLITDANRAEVLGAVVRHFVQMKDMPVVLAQGNFHESLGQFTKQEQLLLILGLDAQSTDLIMPLLYTTGSSPAEAIHKAGWAAGFLNARLPQLPRERQNDIIGTIQSVLDRSDVAVDSDLARLMGVALLNGAIHFRNPPRDDERSNQLMERLAACEKLGPEFWLFDAALNRSEGSPRTIDIALAQIQNPEAPAHLRFKACWALSAMFYKGKSTPPEKVIKAIADALKNVSSEKDYLTMSETNVVQMNNSPESYWNSFSSFTIIVSLMHKKFPVKGVRVFESRAIGQPVEGYLKSNLAAELVGLSETLLATTSDPRLFEGLQSLQEATKARHASVAAHLEKAPLIEDAKVCRYNVEQRTVTIEGLPDVTIPLDDFMAYTLHEFAVNLAK